LIPYINIGLFFEGIVVQCPMSSFLNQGLSKTGAAVFLLIHHGCNKVHYKKTIT